MKYIKSILVLVLLFGLPAASWYFLKGGLDWRKGKVEELVQKGRFLFAFDFTNQDKDRLYELMTHRTCVVKMKNDLNDLDKKVIDQFKKAHTFQFICLAKEGKNLQNWNKVMSEKYHRPQMMSSKNPNFQKAEYMLVDTSGFIRQFYHKDDKETLTRIIEDLAVILPRKKEKDIVMKNKAQ